MKDHGIGLTADQIDRVFNKFYRVDSSETAPEGTGLGMTIVQHLVKEHGGRIWIESDYGKWTNVYFLLPINHNNFNKIKGT